MPARLKTMALVEQIAGAVVTVVTLLDIFLTVLYARAGTALFSPAGVARESGSRFVSSRGHSAAIAAKRCHSAGR